MYLSGKPKTVINAKSEKIDEKSASVLLQDSNATIIRKGVKYKITERRLFEFFNLDSSVTLVICVDVKKQE